ncbi:hypothetical protein ISN45_Aa06g021980 [Arabidopsis thaliana x Arabidopsis arenosa]|uniref:Uncharacterized protein n=1 Tax=Arabidopsis thaliana x Arabidopsis arenosa TaxID=1240361 RepID=A0A8T1YYD6_9BRAS|nr:hypothetical protein ISN45_Aa06g021980 [Arabidopsis thaliana x Arabidopsis arenosa]
MSTGCLSCFKVMCFKKKQSKKEDKPVKTERLPEPAEKKEDVETNAEKKKPFRELCMAPAPAYSYAGSNNSGFEQNFGPIDYGEVLLGSISSSSMNNEFNKVKTFDIRGVTDATAK